MITEDQALRDAVRPVIAEIVAPMREQISRIEKKQREQSKLLQSLTAQLDELSNCVFQLEGQGLALDHRIERANRTAAGAHQIVMQAEHQMQQEIAGIQQRLAALERERSGS